MQQSGKIYGSGPGERRALSTGTRASDVRILHTMLLMRWRTCFTARMVVWMHFLCCGMPQFTICAFLSLGLAHVFPKDVYMRMTIPSVYLHGIFQRMFDKSMAEVYWDMNSGYRAFLQVNGLPAHIYWLDVAIYHLSLSGGYSFLLIIVSHFAPALFQHSNPVLIWLMLTLGHMHYMVIAWLMGRYFRTLDRARQFGCLVFLLVISCIMTNVSCYSLTARVITQFIPMFSVYSTLASIQYLEVDGVGFTFGTFFRDHSAHANPGCHEGMLWPAGVAMLSIAWTTLLYALFCYWLDQTTSSLFWGVPRPWYFCCVQSAKPWLVKMGSSAYGSTGLPEGKPPALLLKGVDKVYENDEGGHVHALSDFNLEVHAGEIFALLGHNGSGKTTMINCAVGMIGATSGEICVNGIPVGEDAAEAQRQLSLCPQATRVFQEISTQKNLEFFASLRGIASGQLEAQVVTVLARVGLEKECEKLGSELSGGQQRRLWLAASLLGARPMILLDEPSSGMDPASRHRLWNTLEWVRGLGSAVIFTTHYLDEADVSADRKAILSGGFVKAVGTSLELKRKYAVGYRLELELLEGVATETAESALRELVLQHVPTAKAERKKTERGEGGEQRAVMKLAFSLPFSEADRLGPLLEEIDSRRAELSVRDYGLQMSSLEDVYLKLAPYGSRVQEESMKDSEAASRSELAPTRAADLDPESAASAGPYVKQLNLFRQMFALIVMRLRVMLEGGSLCFILTRIVLPVVGVNAFIVKARTNLTPWGWSSLAMGFPMTLTTIIGPTIAELSKDVGSKRKLMMLTHGMSPFAYIASGLLSDYIMILPVALALPVFAALARTPYLSGPGLPLVFVMAICYPVHLSVFLNTLQSFVKVGDNEKQTLNAVVQWTASLLGALVPSTIIWLLLAFASDDYPSKAHLFVHVNRLHTLFSLLLPPYSMPGTMLLVMMQSLGAVDKRWHGECIPPKCPVPLSVEYFFTSRAALPLYLAMLPTFFMGVKLLRNAQSASSGEGASPAAGGGSLHEENSTSLKDEGVLAEERRLREGQLGQDDILAYRGLHYTYVSDTGTKVPAVRGVSLSLRRGECFGLLGPNGAGKTTTLACLTGELWPPTAGTVYVEGKDVSREGFGALYGMLGMCLQHDFHLWDFPSGMNHLYFYGRVKGIPEERLEREIDMVLEHVRLKARDAMRPVREYSGGMRRRLSIAIALLGSPSMLFMDEPTAAVDVVVKRELWRIVKSRGSDQMVLLTSHQMEEVEALCDRVGIQVLGRLRALGTVTHLRHRYGQGYQLELVTEIKGEGADGSEDAEKRGAELLGFVRERVHAGAELVDAQAGRAVFQLKDREDGSHIKLSNVFREVSAAKTELRLKDYGLRQPTLEQVFIRFATEQEEAEAAERALNRH